MQKQDTGRFFYQAGAFGLGGHISVPGSFSETLEVKASISLPPSGGRGKARVEGHDYNRAPVAISFAFAESEVAGYLRPDGKHQAVSTVTVNGLNVMNRVTAEKVVCRLVSTEYLAPRTQADSGTEELADGMEVVAVGSYIRDLRIDGFSVKPIHNELLLGEKTYSSLRKSCKDAFVDPDGNAFSLPDLGPIKRTHSAKNRQTILRRFDDCSVLASIYKKVEVEEGSLLKPIGTTVLVPDFGRVRLGEFLISRDARQLTMIVCQLGCPVDGEVAIAGVRGNGSDY